MARSSYLGTGPTPGGSLGLGSVRTQTPTGRNAYEPNRRVRKSEFSKPALHVFIAAMTVIFMTFLSVLAKSIVLRHHEAMIAEHDIRHAGISGTSKHLITYATAAAVRTSNVGNHRNRADVKNAEPHLLEGQGETADERSESPNNIDRRRASDVRETLVAADGTEFEARHDTFSLLNTGNVRPLQVDRITSHAGTKNASLAFFLQISDANVALLPRLLVKLWHPNNVYVIHFDAKIARAKTNLLESSLRETQEFSNVFLLPREPITYKGVSMLLNTLAAMEFMLSSAREWDYFINISGSDYPLVNVVGMSHILGQEAILGRNLTFLQIAPNKEFWTKMKQSRFNFIYYDTSLGMGEKAHELLHTWVPHPLVNDVGVQFVQAEAWMIAHRSFVQYAVRSSVARKMLLLLSTMQDPEEHFFAMLAWKNPGHRRVLAHHAFRAIYWESNGSKSGQHPFFVDRQNGQGIFPFWEHDIRGSNCFFARKFQNPRSKILDYIDHSMSGTHVSADMNAVSNSFSKLQRFVSCISDVDPASEIVRSRNVCR